MSWTPEALEAIQAPDAARTLAAVHEALEGVEDWTGDAVIAAIRAAGAKAEVKGRKLFMPVRAAVSGSTQGPELADIFEIQGRDTCLRVLEQARARAEQT
jgi:glutamyl/glutaminyl-tRNA synthetase